MEITASMIELRLVASPDEVETTRGLFREYEASIGVDLCFQSFERELADLPGKYAPPRGRLYLAFAGGSLAGCVALRPFGDDACEMKRLYVRPAFRGTGLGRTLAERVVADAGEIGYARMMLDTLDSMKTAQSMYESMGFVDTSPYTHNPLPGVRYMQLDLGSTGRQTESQSSSPPAGKRSVIAPQAGTEAAMQQANQRSIRVAIFTRAGWITGSIHLAAEMALVRFLGGDDRFFRLTKVQLPAEESEREFFAMHADEASMVVPLDVTERFPPVGEGQRRHDIACLLGEGTLFGALDVPDGARVSDYLMNQRGFIPVRRCRTPLMELPASLAEPVEIIYLNTRRIIGVAESNPIEAEPRHSSDAFVEM